MLLNVKSSMLLLDNTKIEHVVKTRGREISSNAWSKSVDDWASYRLYGLYRGKIKRFVELFLHVSKYLLSYYGLLSA